MTALLLATVLLQTPHPCDEPPPIVDTTRSPFSATVCVSNLDNDGNVASPVTAVQALVDGTVIGVMTVAAGPPSATGWSLYRFDGLRAPRGARVLTFDATNEYGPSAPSDPLAFTVRGGPPAKPEKARIESKE